MKQPKSDAVSTSATPAKHSGYVFCWPDPFDEWVSYLDARCDFTPGQRHSTRFKAIRKAQELGIPAEMVVAELLRRCGYDAGTVDGAKVASDVEKLYGRSPAGGERGPGGGGAMPARVSPVVVDPELQAKVLATSPCTVADLVKASPVNFGEPPGGDFTVHTGKILSQLYPDGDPWLCLGLSEENCFTERLSWWQLGDELLGQVFIVPQTQKAQRGLTADGRLSYHAKENCESWRYLVCEWDGELDQERLKPGELDRQATFLLHLRSLGGLLVMVVWSGRRGFQGWFYVQDWPDEKRERFSSYCLRLGACSGSIRNISQLCRCPFGLRPKEKGMTQPERQAVMFFDPTQIA